MSNPTTHTTHPLLLGLVWLGLVLTAACFGFGVALAMALAGVD